MIYSHPCRWEGIEGAFSSLASTVSINPVVNGLGIFCAVTLEHAHIYLF